ncbi:MAG: hypothetical protein ABIJ91_03230 [Candidatus Kuenenbacteria bacterium]
MKRLTPKQKAHVVLSALKGEKNSKLSSDYHIHVNQINRWKKMVEEEIDGLFVDRRKKENKSKDRMIDELYRTIGQREVEISWLKKKFGLELPRQVEFD